LPAPGREKTPRGGEYSTLLTTLLGDWAGLDTVEAEILEADESGLIETPKMDILHHLLLFLCWALDRKSVV